MYDQVTYRNCPSHGRYLESFVENGKMYFTRGCSACRAERESNRIFSVACIPDRFKGKTLENYVPKNDSQLRAKMFCIDFVGSIDTNIANGVSALFYGSHGLGKTHLSIAIAFEVMKHGKTARYSTVSNMFSEIRETYGGRGSELEAVRAFQNVDFLVLDEIGAQNGTADEARLLTDVLNGRYANMKSTFILSNLDIEGIEKALTPRILDRLRENGGKAFKFIGTSYRGQ